MLSIDRPLNIERHRFVTGTAIRKHHTETKMKENESSFQKYGRAVKDISGKEYSDWIKSLPLDSSFNKQRFEMVQATHVLVRRKIEGTILVKRIDSTGKVIYKDSIEEKLQ